MAVPGYLHSSFYPYLLYYTLTWRVCQRRQGVVLVHRGVSISFHAFGTLRARTAWEVSKEAPLLWVFLFTHGGNSPVLPEKCSFLLSFQEPGYAPSHLSAQKARNNMLTLTSEV